MPFRVANGSCALLVQVSASAVGGTLPHDESKSWRAAAASTEWRFSIVEVRGSHHQHHHQHALLPLARMHGPPLALASATVAAPQRPSGTQLWLQDQLLKLPFMSGMRAQLRGSAPPPPEAQEPSAATSSAPDAAACGCPVGTGTQATTGMASAVGKGKQRKKRKGALKQPPQPQQQADVRAATAETADLLAERLSTAPPVALEAGDTELWEAFVEMDHNGDAKIDFVELRVALEKLGLPCTPEYMVGIMREYDLNHDQQIDFQEFKFYVNKRDAEIERAFKLFDLDGNGEISFGELQEALHNAGIPASAEDVRRMVALVDTDRDYSVSYDEFRRLAAFMPRSGSVMGHPSLYAHWWKTTSMDPATALDMAASGALGAPQQHLARAHQQGVNRNLLFLDLLGRGCMAVALVGVVSQIFNPTRSVDL